MDEAYIEALRTYAGGLRVILTDEAAENAWRAFLGGMDANLVHLIGQDDYEWLEAAMRHSFEVGWHAALRRATDLVTRTLDAAA